MDDTQFDCTAPDLSEKFLLKFFDGIQQWKQILKPRYSVDTTSNLFGLLTKIKNQIIIKHSFAFYYLKNNFSNQTSFF